MKVEQVLQDANIPAILADLECDGATMVISHYLQQADIPHKLWLGWILDPETGKRITIHNCIELADGRTIDYKARMWAGAEAPEGIFRMKKYRQFYEFMSYSNPKDYSVILAYLTGGGK